MKNLPSASGSPGGGSRTRRPRGGTRGTRPGRWWAATRTRSSCARAGRARPRPTSAAVKCVRAPAGAAPRRGRWGRRHRRPAPSVTGGGAVARRRRRHPPTSAGRWAPAPRSEDRASRCVGADVSAAARRAPPPPPQGVDRDRGHHRRDGVVRGPVAGDGEAEHGGHGDRHDDRDDREDREPAPAHHHETRRSRTAAARSRPTSTAHDAWVPRCSKKALSLTFCSGRNTSQRRPARARSTPGTSPMCSRT